MSSKWQKIKENSKVERSSLAKKVLMAQLRSEDRTKRANDILQTLYMSGEYKYSTTFIKNLLPELQSDSMAKSIKLINADGEIEQFRILREDKGSNYTIEQLRHRNEIIDQIINNPYLNPEHISARIRTDAERFSLTAEQYREMWDFFNDVNNGITISNVYDSNSIISSTAEYIELTGKIPEELLDGLSNDENKTFNYRDKLIEAITKIRSEFDKQE